MSELTAELPRTVVAAWRKFAATPEFQAGIDWLRRNRSTEDGETDMQLVKAAAKWKGYVEALDDVQDKLTDIPKKEDSLDEPPLNAPTR